MVVCRMTLVVRKKRRGKTEKKTKWWKLQKKECHEEFRQKKIRNMVCVLSPPSSELLPQLVWDAKGRFPGPNCVCPLVKYLQVLGMFSSSYMIVVCHYAICCPLQAHHRGARQCWNTFIVLAWGLSLLLRLPQVFIVPRSEAALGVYECWGNFAESWGLKVYMTWMTLAVFILPVLIITVCQVERDRPFTNCHTLLVTSSAISVAGLLIILSSAVPCPPGGEVLAAMSKTVKMTLVIVLVYCLCWTPFFSVQLWVVFTLLMLLASLNSCTNPWIYSAFSSSVSPELRLLHTHLAPVAPYPMTP
uniref:G-protein coupled receptors family 1 profile domain-containing protein n=1 Tax=Monopterus albus TaxID=43700 RepID=A0A3Q3IW73_MONAL